MFEDGVLGDAPSSSELPGLLEPGLWSTILYSRRQKVGTWL